MLDRAIGIIGIALALVFGFLPLIPLKIPVWLTYSGIAVSVFLVGIALGLAWSDYRQVKPTTTDEPQLVETNLFLQFSDARSVPTEKNPRNIRSWYALFTEIPRVRMANRWAASECHRAGRSS
jgi:hypothetical protein